jgi:hypothetical protein
MKIQQQKDSPKQYELVDDDGSILGCFDTPEIATSEMEKAKANKSNKGKNQASKEASK